MKIFLFVFAAFIPALASGGDASTTDQHSGFPRPLTANKFARRTGTVSNDATGAPAGALSCWFTAGSGETKCYYFDATRVLGTCFYPNEVKRGPDGRTSGSCHGENTIRDAQHGCGLNGGIWLNGQAADATQSAPAIGPTHVARDPLPPSRSAQAPSFNFTAPGVIPPPSPAKNYLALTDRVGAAGIGTLRQSAPIARNALPASCECGYSYECGPSTGYCDPSGGRGSLGVVSQDQGQMNSCGTTALSEDLSYFGNPVSVNDIDGSIRNNGSLGVLFKQGGQYTSPHDLTRFADDHGMRASEKYGASLEDIASMIDQGVPVMALIQVPEGPHYVILDGYDRDPKTGKITALHGSNWGKRVVWDAGSFDAAWASASENVLGMNLLPGRAMFTVVPQSGNIRGKDGTMRSASSIALPSSGVGNYSVGITIIQGASDINNGLSKNSIQSAGNLVSGVGQTEAGTVELLGGVTGAALDRVGLNDLGNSVAAASSQVGDAIYSVGHHGGAAVDDLTHGNVGGAATEVWRGGVSAVTDTVEAGKTLVTGAVQQIGDTGHAVIADIGNALGLGNIFGGGPSRSDAIHGAAVGLANKVVKDGLAAHESAATIEADLVAASQAWYQQYGDGGGCTDEVFGNMKENGLAAAFPPGQTFMLSRWTTCGGNALSLTPPNLNGPSPTVGSSGGASAPSATTSPAASAAPATPAPGATVSPSSAETQRLGSCTCTANPTYSYNVLTIAPRSKGHPAVYEPQNANCSCNAMASGILGSTCTGNCSCSVRIPDGHSEGQTTYRFATASGSCSCVAQ